MLRRCAYIVTLVPSVLRWRLAETKPGARRTEISVASVRSSTSRRWFAGSTVNTLIRVTTSLFAEIVVTVSLPSERSAAPHGSIGSCPACPSLVRALVRMHRRYAHRREGDRADNRRHGLRTSPDIAPGYRSHRKACSQ